MKSTRVVVIPDGANLVDALSSEAATWWQASGTVENVVLRDVVDGAERELGGRHTLVSLSGPAGGPYTLLVARGSELAAGELVSARSAGVRALRVPEREEAEPLAPPPARKSAPLASGPRATGWSARAAQAAAAQKIEEEVEAPRPEAGDLVHHFAFGWCEVVMADGERLKLRDVSGQGRVREVVSDMLDVRGPTEQDGKRAFTLTRRK